MKVKREKLNDLVSNFFANIGVAWFTGGVVGIFLNRNLSQIEILYSLSWGIGFASLSLLFATAIIRSRN